MFAIPSPTTAPQLTTEQHRALLARQVSAELKQSYQQLCRIQQIGIKAVWNHPYLTPQQACDALGTDAGKFFIAHGKLTEAVAAIAAQAGVQPDILLPSAAFAVNEDGTVTVTE